MTQERTGVYKVRTNPLTLLGNEIKVGQKAPAFTLPGANNQTQSLESSKGKTRIIAAVVSLDTGVCDRESKRLNDIAKEMPNVEILVVSKDLPFAQARWCGTADAQNIKTASAFRDDSTFATDYGVLVKETRLLARSVFVVDASDVVRHVQYVPDLLEEPNYDALKEAAKKAAGA
ncbi:MAG: thiol peroxidase [Chloroflexi bacterium]|nr:thiol peroxidase [Chloroflexota bacterium]